MGKTSINKKKVLEFIKESRANNKTDQEIYNELKEQYFDKKTIAQMIAGTVTQERKMKYKALNTTLLVLISLTIILKILFVLGMTVETGEVLTLLFILIVPLINIWFFYEVSRYNAMVYKIIGILTLASLFKSLSKMADSSTLDILLTLGFGIGIITLSFYLGNKLIPRYSLKNMQRDENGEYIL